MKLLRAAVWDISLGENSNIIQLFIIVNRLGGWPAFIVALWEHSFDQRIHIFPLVSPFLAKSYILPPSEHTWTIWSFNFSFLTICTHKQHLDCILLWHINLHIWNIYFKKKNVAKTTKNKAVGCGSCRLKSDWFVLVETPCTVPLCLENASKIFF